MMRYGNGNAAGFVSPGGYDGWVRLQRACRRLPGAKWRSPALCALALLLLLPFAGPIPALAAPGWQGAGKLPAEFSAPRAALLPDGRVLAVSASAAAVYTMATDTWVTPGALPFDATGAELIVLAGGQALLAGGVVNNFATNPFAPPQQVARFDPATNSWTKRGEMQIGRSGHTMTALANGQILVVGGGVRGLSPRQPQRTANEVELYNPATEVWSKVAPLAQARLSHTATRLADGRVLVVGGRVSKIVNSEFGGYDTLAGAEIYDPSANSWQPAAPMSQARSGHTAALLHDGTVLVVGGDSGGSLTAERYDPAKGSWSAAGTLRAYWLGGVSATVLPNGAVLVAGGRSENDASVKFAQI